MTNDELNQRIAERLGWQWYALPCTDQRALAPNAEAAATLLLGDRLDTLVPSYCDSLDLMHDVEAEIERRGLAERYTIVLSRYVPETHSSADELWSIVRATAEQRCRAALEVL